MENVKFYSQRAISITTFFGGPLAAGILLRQNFLNIGKEKQAINALFLGIIATFFIFFSIFVLPDYINEKIPDAIIPAIYTLIIYWIVEKTQGQVLKNHKENNGEFYSSWKAAKIGAISMLAILFSVFSVAFISGDLSENKNSFDTESYTERINTFFENEDVSIKVLQSFNTDDIDYLIKEVNISIVLWKENKTIIGEIITIENLPIDLSIQMEKLKEYSELRIEHFELILKSLNEDTDKYSSQIKDIGLKIEKVIREFE